LLTSEDMELPTWQFVTGFPFDLPLATSTKQSTTVIALCSTKI